MDSVSLSRRTYRPYNKFTALSQLERMQASLYNTKVVKALTLGWLLDYQERTEFEYDKLIDSLKRGYYGTQLKHF